jgi:Protein of unknown function (DUF1302)
MSARPNQVLVMSSLMLATGVAQAMPIETGSDLRLSWDNTLDLTLIGQPNQSWYGPYGNCAPGAGAAEYRLQGVAVPCLGRSGLTSSRFDWLSQVVLSYQDLGFQISSEGWYDPAYGAWKQNAPALPAGGRSNSYFSAGETDPVGNIELNDAFLYGRTELGADRPFSFRLGRQVTLWGESVYFIDNGIAAGQAPVDTYRYQSGGYYQADQSFLPVGQGSFSWQAFDAVSLIGYYQFEWRRSRISPYDAYDSTVTMLGDPFTRQIALPAAGGTAIAYNRAADLTSDSTDQFGLGLRGRQGEYDWGLFGLSYDAKTPTIYYRVPAGPAPVGSYSLVYPKGTEIYGVSLAGPLGDASFGAELSARRRMPLVNAGIVLDPGETADNNGHPRYPLGDTLHAQFSWDYATPPLPGIPGGAHWTGEIAANDLLSVTANADQLVPGRTHAAAALRTAFVPQFFQIWPRLDLTLPIGLGWNFVGLSQTDETMNRNTADLTLGATLTLDQSWKFGLSATHYFGKSENGFLPFDPVGVQHALSESDFLGFTIARSF